jgi:hypothetical protein
MERRKFLKLSSGILVTAALDPIEVVQSFAEDDIALTSLESYQSYVEPERTDFEENVVSQKDLFIGYYPITRERQLIDFNMYYLLYRAAEIQYGVPWQLLWVMHIQETQVSTHPNPAASGYEGAMQRSPIFFPFEQTLQAAENWEYLRQLPQRYNQGYAPFRNDYREILWAGMHIPERARNFFPHLGFEEGILMTVRKAYSAEVYGNQRVNQFLKIRPLFEPYSRSL